MEINSKEYKTHVFPIGKYKGERISEFNNLSYLEWLFEMTKLDDTSRQVIGLRIYQLTTPKSYTK
jgi:uncharacterized protein (DUF3820 family)